MNINIRSVVLIVAAILIAGITALLARSWLTNDRPQEVVSAPAPTSAVEVLVARNDLPAGRILQQGDLRWQAWPDVDLPEQYIRKTNNSDMADMAGSVVRSGIRAGEPLSRGRVATPGDRGFMAAVLTPGMRAITVRVDPTSGIGGFVFPGDRVDMILSHRIDDSETRTQNRAGETVLTNVRVLAIDQRTDDQKNTPSPANTVTLEVTPKQVERVVVARALGDLSLSLRSLASPEPDSGDTENTETAGMSLGPIMPAPGESYTWDSEVSQAISGKSGNADAVVVARGGQVQRINVEDSK